MLCLSIIHGYWLAVCRSVFHVAQGKNRAYPPSRWYSVHEKCPGTEFSVEHTRRDCGDADIGQCPSRNTSYQCRTGNELQSTDRGARTNIYKFAQKSQSNVMICMWLMLDGRLLSYWRTTGNRSSHEVWSYQTLRSIIGMRESFRTYRGEIDYKYRYGLKHPTFWFLLETGWLQ